MTPAPDTGASAVCCSGVPFGEGFGSGRVFDALLSISASHSGARAFACPHNIGSITVIYHHAAIAIFVLATISQATAGPVLKDHISNSSNWNGLAFIAQNFTLNNSTGHSGAAATFVGNGSNLKTVSGVFGHESFMGVINGGSPLELDFRILFHESIEAYESDPFLSNPSTAGMSFVVASTSNSDWLVPVGQSNEGHDLFHWEFDVSSLQIGTTVGEVQLITILPETDGFSGPTVLAFSNASSAIGLEPDWFRSQSLGPDSLPDLVAPHPNGAYRITTIPEPSAFVLLSAVFLIVASVSQRKQSLQNQKPHSHST